MDLSLKLASKSIFSKILRSMGLITISLIMSFTVALIGLISFGMQHGSDNVKARMGADMIVVPEGYGDDLEGILLTTSKNYFYMDEDVLEEIKKIDGIEVASAQTFLMTLEASCCDQSVQIIGIDTDTDFTVSPWIDGQFLTSLKSGQIIVGSDVGVREDDSFQMFGETYEVAGILDKSGSSMDYSVFIDRSSMDTLMQQAQDAGQGVIADVNSDDVSAVMIRTKGIEDDSAIVGKLSRIEGVDVVTSESVSSRLTEGLRDMRTVYIVIIVILFAVGIIMMFLIHYMTLNERKSEITTLRVLGVSGKDIRAFLIKEILILSSIGAVLGTSIAALSFTVLFRLIDVLTDVPFTMPHGGETALILITDLVVIAVLGPLCAVSGIRKICPDYILE